MRERRSPAPTKSIGHRNRMSLPPRGRWIFAAGKKTEGVSERLSNCAYRSLRCHSLRMAVAILPSFHKANSLSLPCGQPAPSKREPMHYPCRVAAHLNSSFLITHYSFRKRADVPPHIGSFSVLLTAPSAQHHGPQDRITPQAHHLPVRANITSAALLPRRRQEPAHRTPPARSRRRRTGRRYWRP